MSDHLRGYVLDCGFLVFGCGEMVAADDVQSVVNYATKDYSPCFIVTLKLDCGGSGDDGGDLWLAPMSPDQERNYRPMASVDDGSTFVAAEASTGCEPERDDYHGMRYRDLVAFHLATERVIGGDLKLSGRISDIMDELIEENMK